MDPYILEQYGPDAAYLAKKYGMTRLDVDLAEASLATAPPMTDAQAWEIGRLFGFIPVDKETGKPVR